MDFETKVLNKGLCLNLFTYVVFTEKVFIRHKIIIIDNNSNNIFVIAL